MWKDIKSVLFVTSLTFLILVAGTTIFGLMVKYVHWLSKVLDI